MFQGPNRENRSVPPQSPRDRQLLFIAQTARVVSGAGFVVSSLAGLEVLFGNEEILDQIQPEMENVPLTLGVLVAGLREKGVSDEMIGVFILGLSAILILTHVAATNQVAHIRNKQRDT